jgi:AcrR family transcriptional regulator
MPRAKQRTPELRHHLLLVAINLLAQEGVAGFTARNIARQAGTSTPALYELFGDRAGLLREVYYEGFRRLDDRLQSARTTENPRADLLALVRLYRGFLADNPSLTEVMFSHPFVDFRPGPDEAVASASIRKLLIANIRRCLDAEMLYGNATDIASVLDAMIHGLGLAESAGRLGRSKALVDRRWNRALGALLDGLT